MHKCCTTFFSCDFPYTDIQYQKYYDISLRYIKAQLCSVLTTNETCPDMSQLSCSFYSYCHTECDVSSRYPGHKEFYPLIACGNNVKPHLRTLKVTQTCVSSEKELILARAGLFNGNGQGLTICPRHRAELGVMYRPLKKCYHPLHGTRKRKPDRGVNLQMAKEIKTKWNVLVAIGAGKLSSHVFS